jgi:hypothetical protein
MLHYKLQIMKLFSVYLSLFSSFLRSIPLITFSNYWRYLSFLFGQWMCMASVTTYCSFFFLMFVFKVSACNMIFSHFVVFQCGVVHWLSLCVCVFMAWCTISNDKKTSSRGMFKFILFLTLLKWNKAWVLLFLW